MGKTMKHPYILAALLSLSTFGTARAGGMDCPPVPEEAENSHAK